MSSTSTPSTDWIWNKVLEIYKARMTAGLALLVAMVTLTGYGISQKRPAILLAAALLPTAIFGIDYTIKRVFAAPFLYLLFLSNEASLNLESDLVLFLDFAKPNSRLAGLRALPAGEERQRAFLHRYLARGLPLTIVLLLAATAGEVLLSFLVQ